MPNTYNQERVLAEAAPYCNWSLPCYDLYVHSLVYRLKKDLWAGEDCEPLLEELEEALRERRTAALAERIADERRYEEQLEELYAEELNAFHDRIDGN